MIPAVHLAFASGILGLGQSPSSFGFTLALILIFVVIMGGLANALIGYVVAQVMAERRQNIERRVEYDARHRSQ